MSRGVRHSENLIKTSLIYIVPYFNFGVGALFRGAKFNKDPGATELVHRPDIVPKHFDKLNPEPVPTGKARPDLQPCSRSQPKTFQNRKIFRELNKVTLAELPSKLTRQTLVLTCSLRAESLFVCNITVSLPQSSLALVTTKIHL